MRLSRIHLLLPALVAAAGCAPAQDSTASSSDTLAVTTARVTVRTQPLASATAVVHLPAGTLVRRYACTGGWCRVAIERHLGYALEEYLGRNAAQAAPDQGRGYVNSSGQWVPSPTRTPDNQPPAGATARCRDGTFSFSQSRSGTCSYHGGVAEWL